ncbi:HTH-type transcriptional repressor Bm3R1 [Paenibacillus polymyxa M1]|uniref:TetR family transcriptional regulator n=1 Tax=Paenibacillus polymyxa (strain SC2) TaxID=886882 RepID=E3E487_PAEPS|nr:TetR family transcriptional regulator [Paenibacillus polymyxa SC2]CCC85330.1 HTH-type transcriptional repressor Bm3R1 [Paenibacillus polymyxa M1]
MVGCFLVVIELTAVKNFDNITIQDIADQANVNRGTIYLHYQDKYDLLNQIMETHINELKEIICSQKCMSANISV